MVSCFLNELESHLPQRNSNTHVLSQGATHNQARIHAAQNKDNKTLKYNKNNIKPDKQSNEQQARNQTNTQATQSTTYRAQTHDQTETHVDNNDTIKHNRNNIKKTTAKELKTSKPSNTPMRIKQTSAQTIRHWHRTTHRREL